MKRDGYNTSLWQRTPGINIAGASLPEKCDVLIAGGGITALSLGLELQRGGKKVVIAEAHTLGFGTTAGTTAHLNTILDTTYKQIISGFGKENAALIAGLTEKAISFVEKNISDNNINCGFERTDGYTFAEDDEQVKGIDEIYEGANEVRLPITYAGNIPVPIPFKKAVKFGGQAKFNPTEYISGLAKAFEQAGGMIVEQCMVTNTNDGKETVTVETTSGNIECAHFVWATHTTPGVNLLSFRLAPYRSYAMACELEDSSQEFVELVYDGGDPYHYYRMQKVDGINYLIAGGEDHKTGHEENTEACFTKLEAHVKKYFKIKKPANKWSSQYYEPADGIPYIGIMPGGTNVFTATGYSGNGMIYSAIAAIILSEWLLTGDTKYKDLFSPSRLKPVAGFTNFIKENADVVKEMVSGWFSAEKLASVSEMAAGEGKVVKLDGHKMGLYKDETGKYHAVNTTCTHAGCSISWNNSERSWDCPCHGARYNEDGKVLTGPTVKELKQIDLSKAGK